MSWRNCLIPHIKQNGLMTVYQFGVYTGQSIIDIMNAYAIAGVRISEVYGFDSFVGLPRETAEPLSQECWQEGGFSTTKLLGVEGVQDALELTRNKITGCLTPSIKLHLVPGFFEDSLTAEAVKVYDLKPAHYVDIDCDLYISSKTCLTYMVKNRLITNGTLVGFDDIGGVVGWEECKGGEGRAWKEVQEEYGLETQLIEQCGTSYPHVQQLFRVNSIG